MADNWIDYQLAHMPAPLLGEWGTKWAELIGTFKGISAEYADSATLQHLSVSATPDAYPYLGRDRRILRAPNETDAAYAARLRNVFDFWALSGKEAGIIACFAAAGIVPIVVENQDTANVFGHWARFAVYVNGDGVFSDPPTWDSFDWDDGTRWDFVAADGPLVDYLVACIRLMKPAHTRCVGLVIARTGFPSVIVPVDPTPVEPPLVFDDLLLSYFDMYFDVYLG